MSSSNKHDEPPYEVAKYMQAKIALFEAQDDLKKEKTRNAELMAEIHSLTMILAHEKAEKNELREQNATLTSALDEATTCRKCGYEVVVDKSCPYCHGTKRDYRHLPPASRALCERLFGGGK